jgi:hypothetical protein
LALRPAATITLGNLRYTEQAASIGVTLAPLPGVNALTLALPAGARFEAAPDDPATVELDSGDADGAGRARVLTGKVRAVRRSPLVTEVTAGDAGADLARLRPCATFEKSSAQEAIRALADAAVAPVAAIDVDLPLAVYAAHQGRTAAELAGAIATMNGDGELMVSGWPEGEVELALRYGRELSAYQVQDMPGPPARRAVVGHGAAGSASAPDALRPSAEPLAGNAPAPGRDAVWRAVGALRVPKAAATASAGAQASAAAAGKRLRARGFLMPALRPGLVIEVQELPGGLSGGPWIVTRVSHRLRPSQAGATSFEAVSGEGGGLGALLASALAAIGGLF